MTERRFANEGKTKAASLPDERRRTEAPYGTPGKATLVEALQLDADSDAELDDDRARRAASEGFGGGGAHASSLPHYEAIQRAFGRHAIGDVEAHVGGAAAEACDELGANAYASGARVAFATAPDLHTAAHELAHVVQQRGGVGDIVGRRGDAHEQHADAVADLVVRGESAEPLLDRYARSGGGGARSPAAVQRQHRERPADRRPLAEARAEPAIQALIDRVVAAIALNETGGREPTESRVHVSADEHASYASATQATPVHAIPLLQGRGIDDPAQAQARRDFATLHGLSQEDLALAAHVQAAAGVVWDAVVIHGKDLAGVRAAAPAELETSGFTDGDIARMQQMHAFREMLNAMIPRYRALQASTRALLETRVARARVWVAAELAQVGSADAAAARVPTASEAEAIEHRAPLVATPEGAVHAEPAPDATDGNDAAQSLEAYGKRDAAIAFINAPARPELWARWTVTQRRAWSTRQQRTLAGIRLDERAVTATRTHIADEAFVRPETTVLGFTQHDVFMYTYFIHGIAVGEDETSFDHFAEDRAGWCRTALARVHEQHVTDGHAARTLDDAIGDAATADHGYAMSRMEFGTFVRGYLATHPLASDETVVTEAAYANAGHHNETYARRILHNFRAAPSQEAAEPVAEPREPLAPP